MYTCYVQDKYKLKDWAIVTVPRTGSHFLQERIYQHTGLTIERIYEQRPNDKKIITIARDPIEIVKSSMAMIRHQDQKLGLGKRDIGEQNAIFQYTSDYLYFAEKSDIVVDFNKLILDPFETTCAIAKILNIKIINKKYENNLKDSINPRYLVTSKNVPEYQEISSEVGLLDLSKFQEAYIKLLSKSIALHGV